MFLKDTDKNQAQKEDHERRENTGKKHGRGTMSRVRMQARRTLIRLGC